jgi:hypothetical protein
MLRLIGIFVVCALTIACDSEKKLKGGEIREMPPKAMGVSKDEKTLVNNFEYLNNVETDETITQEFVFQGADYSMLLITNEQPTMEMCNKTSGISFSWTQIRGRMEAAVAANQQFQARTSDRLRLTVKNTGLCAKISLDFVVKDMTN